MPLCCDQEFRLKGNILHPKKLNFYMTKQLSVIIRKTHMVAYKRRYLYYKV